MIKTEEFEASFLNVNTGINDSTGINVNTGINDSTRINYNTAINYNTGINDTFTITLSKGPNKSLLSSLVKTGILLGATITDNYQTIIFRATNITRINNNLEIYPQTRSYKELPLNYLYYLTKQIEYLIIHEKKSFYTIKPENIIIIDETKMIYLSTSDLLDIENNNLTIFKPFEKTVYSSPELNAIHSIPAQINYKTIYYSIGLLMLFIITKNITINIHTTVDEDYLKQIKGTKIYFTIKRCLQIEPEQRTILFV
jgi:hypothetical protein